MKNLILVLTALTVLAIFGCKKDRVIGFLEAPRFTIYHALHSK